MTKLGLVGTGKIAKEILPVLDRMPEIELAAICGTARSGDRVRQLAGQYGIANSYTDFAQMLEADSKPDVLYLAVPNHLHYPMAMQALEAGFHVFLEKPFSLKAEDSKRLIEKARDKGLLILEAISNQYLPIYGELKKALPKLGQIRLVEMNFSQYSSRYDRFEAGEYFPVFDPACGGGALMDINIYNLHMAVGLFGVPEEASYTANKNRGVDTSGVVSLRYPGFCCNLIGAKDCQGPNQVLIEGTGGYLRIQAPSNTLMAALEFYDVKTGQTVVLYKPDTDQHRMVYEFRELDRLLNADDPATLRRLQEETLAVSRLAEELA